MPGRRVCILAYERPFVARQGSSTYLDHLARSLVASGAEVHLRILQPPRRDQLRLRLEPGFLDAYASVALHGATTQSPQSMKSSHSTAGPNRSDHGSAR